MKADSTLYVSSVCGGCKDAIREGLKYPDYVELVYPNESTASYDRMVNDKVSQTPTLVTKSGDRVGGGTAITSYLYSTYGRR